MVKHFSTSLDISIFPYGGSAKIISNSEFSLGNKLNTLPFFISKELAPTEDRGVFLGVLMEPEGATLNYTRDYLLEVEDELAIAKPTISLMGGKLETIVPVSLEDLGQERTLVVIKKVNATPEKYPRRSGIPAKRPLYILSES